MYKAWLALIIFSRTIYLAWFCGIVRSFKQGRRRYSVNGTLRRHQRNWSTRTRGRYIWRVAQKFWAGWAIGLLEIEWHLVGHERIDWSRPHIFVANHQSLIDVFALIMLIPGGRYMAKKQILRYGLKSTAKRSGQLVVDRNKKRDPIIRARNMKEIREQVEAWPDANLVIFPEGTRTRDGRLGEFRGSAFVIARDYQIPIIPVAISKAFEALPKGLSWRLARKPSIHIEFGKEIPAFSENTVDELRFEARHQIKHMLANAQVRAKAQQRPAA